MVEVTVIGDGVVVIGHYEPEWKKKTREFEQECKQRLQDYADGKLQPLIHTAKQKDMDTSPHLKHLETPQDKANQIELLLSQYDNEEIDDIELIDKIREVIDGEIKALKGANINL